MTDSPAPRWILRFEPRASRDLQRIDAHAKRRILRTLHAISSLEDPRTRGVRLTGNLAGNWRYRVGDYRIICELIHDELVILSIGTGPRRQVYD